MPLKRSALTVVLGQMDAHQYALMVVLMLVVVIVLVTMVNVDESRMQSLCVNDVFFV